MSEAANHNWVYLESHVHHDDHVIGCCSHDGLVEVVAVVQSGEGEEVHEVERNDELVDILLCDELLEEGIGYDGNNHTDVLYVRCLLLRIASIYSLWAEV